MRGLPKHIATKQDYINLLEMADNYDSATSIAAGEAVMIKPVDGKIPEGGLTLASPTIAEMTIAAKQVQDFDAVKIIESNTNDFRQGVLDELIAILGLNDDFCTRATTPIDEKDPEKGWNTEEIENPMPLWKLKGFESRQDVAALITKYGG